MYASRRFHRTAGGIRYQVSGPATPEQIKRDTTISDASWGTLQRARDDRPLSIDDRWQILETSQAVLRALDLRRFEFLPELLDDTFEQHSGLLAAGSPQEFIARTVENPILLRGVRHELTNTTVWRLGEHHARLMGYLHIIQFALRDGDQPATLPRLVAHGFILDDLHRIADHWRLTRRTIDQLSVHPDWIPDPTLRQRCSQTEAPHPTQP